VSSIALFGFGDTESARLEAELIALGNLGTLSKCTSGISKKDLALNFSGAIIWSAGTGLTNPSAIVDAASEANVPVVVVMSSIDIDGINATQEDIEVCFPPCSAEEIALRLNIAMSTNTFTKKTNIIAHGSLIIDCDRYEVTLAGRKVDLTYKEYELLKFLASHPDRVFSRESLLRSVWEYDYFGGTRTVDVHVRRLRSKIDDVSNNFIATQWNVGYRFRSPGARK
tara:strand:+ start:239 stop:916 length:678 start_codon:yes stop_codon:yes gene_type:complete